MKQLSRVFIVAPTLAARCSVAEVPLSPQEPPDSNAATTQEQAKPTTKDWPFLDAENTSVITLTRITNGSRSILYVVHDKDGDRQFLGGGDVSEDDASTVALKEVAELDPSIKALADFPAGWAAERADVKKPRKRFQR